MSRLQARRTVVVPANPAPNVFADLLTEAAESGRLMETLQLLSDLAGPAMVRAAVSICIDRRLAALLRDTTPEEPDERSGSRDDASEARICLVRQLPDPVARGRADRAGT